MKKIILGLTLILTLSLTLTGCNKYKQAEMDDRVLEILKDAANDNEELLDRDKIENNVLSDNHLCILGSLITSTEQEIAQEYLNFDREAHCKIALDKAVQVNERITGKYIIGDYDDIEEATYLMTGLDIYENYFLLTRGNKDLYPQDYISFYENEINQKETDGDKLELLYNLISPDGPNKEIIESLLRYEKTLMNYK